MIYGEAQLEFGTGDVRVITSVISHNEGVIAFKNQAPQEIGEVAVAAGEVVRLTDFDVVMYFPTVKSVDLHILTLNNLKKEMENQKNDNRTV